MVVSLCGLFKVDTVFVVSVESPLTSCALSALGRLTSPAGRHGITGAVHYVLRPSSGSPFAARLRIRSTFPGVLTLFFCASYNPHVPKEVRLRIVIY